ncbi:hypothetical protein [Aquabacterium sp. OR-4]|uniref:hypothetical protein n=1 Tax=Aquabacterium sp. OR-4 TaxID=2978127 RepID=UPI0021B3D5C2|nr:hypothetical protein [Aquabacterium sp. OR-4]MDT7836634.1 hypothetical protein [Aquabacterium sp. OR-4]
MTATRTVPPEGDRPINPSADTPLTPVQLLQLLDGWLDNTGHDDGHPWRVSIAQTLKAQPDSGAKVDAKPATGIPLMSGHEASRRTGGTSAAEMSEDPALMLNPAASPRALLAAAQSRADLLYRQLYAWTCEPTDGDTCAAELAELLAPTAYELDTILDALRLKIAREVPRG